MTQADRVYITPPTNTSAIDHPMMFPPRDPTRRRFLVVAAVASVVSAGTLAAATQAPNVPQAVTIPQASPALRDAIRAFSHAHAGLVKAKAANTAAWTWPNDGNSTIQRPKASAAKSAGSERPAPISSASPRSRGKP
jgi:hypothetical protein